MLRQLWLPGFWGGGGSRRELTDWLSCKSSHTTSFSFPTEDRSAIMTDQSHTADKCIMRSVYTLYLTFEWEVSWGLGPRRVFEGSLELLRGSQGPPCLTLICRFLASCVRKNSSLATFSFAPGQIFLQLIRTHRPFGDITGLAGCLETQRASTSSLTRLGLWPLPRGSSPDVGINWTQNFPIILSVLNKEPILQGQRHRVLET